MHKISRRKFLINTFLLTITGSFLSCNGIKRYNPPAVSRVVKITNPESTDQTEGKDNDNLNDEVVRSMVNRGILLFTGRKSLETAWQDLIPDPDKKVAIKVNCQIEAIYTKSKVVNPIVEGLKLRGVRESNIIIYDLKGRAFNYAGFTKNTGNGIKVGTIEELGGYSWKKWFRAPIPLIGNKFSKIVAGEGIYGCDYIINVPVLKALDGYAGVTLSMKNHFGSIANCSRLHSDIHDAIASLNAHELIASKTRLIVVDGIFAQYRWHNGRKQDTVCKTNTILVGNDTVAIDYIGWQLIEELRMKFKVPPVQPRPDYIFLASTKYGLGNADKRKIHILGN